LIPVQTKTYCPDEIHQGAFLILRPIFILRFLS
jgi:hypothetical protein